MGEGVLTVAARTTFSSLAIPNYRIWFVGATFSNIGQWMARTAQSWLVLMVLTNQSAQALGMVNALAFLPQLFLSPYAGTIADRFPKRRIMMIAQSIMAVDAAVLATLVLTGQAQLWHVYTIAVIDGFCMCFDGPARQAFVSELVGTDQLTNAISLNSASFNTARLIGPGVAGVLIALFGTGPVIAVNVVAYAVMIVALAMLNTSKLFMAKASGGRGRIADGIRYVRRRPDLLILLSCGLAVGGFGFNFAISNALMATQAYGKSAGEYGALGSIMGIGALAAALLSASRGRNRFRHVLGGMAGYAVFSLWAALSPSYWMFAALQAPIGLCTITALVGANSMLQSSTAPQYRGRVMALWGLVIMGSTPIVSPIVGSLGDLLGPRSTVLFGVCGVGVAVLFITLAMVHNDQLRLRLDTSGRTPRLRLEHPDVTEDVTQRPRYM